MNKTIPLSLFRQFVSDLWEPCKKATQGTRDWEPPSLSHVSLAPSLLLNNKHSSGQNWERDDIFDTHPSLPILSSPLSTVPPTSCCPRGLEFSKRLRWNLKIQCPCLVLLPPKETDGDNAEGLRMNEMWYFQGRQRKPGITMEKGSKKDQNQKNGSEHWDWDVVGHKKEEETHGQKLRW